MSVTSSPFAAASTLARAALAVSCATGWSNFIGVEVTLPKTSTVAVHSKRNGSSAGLVYLIVTAPVVASFESVMSTGECSFEAMPYPTSPPRRSPRPACESIVITDDACSRWTAPQRFSTLSAIV